MSDSCSTCASCVRVADHNAVYQHKRQYGGDMCSTFGHMLSIPAFSTEDNEAVKVRIRSTCNKYTTDVASSDEMSDLNAPSQVATPSVSVMMDIAARIGPVLDEERAQSCAGCKFYVSGAAVNAKWGFTAGICGARGTLIASNECVPTARACDIGERGVPADTTDGLMLLPQYGGTAFVPMTPSSGANMLDAAHYSKHNAVDPREWPTDREVTEDDTSNGIRAWRAIEDPDGVKPPLYLPIYDHKLLFHDGFDPRDTYASYKPDLYVDHQMLLWDFAFLYGGPVSHDDDPGLDEVMALIGEAGTGKTEFCVYVAWLMNVPFVRISIAPSSEAADLIGEMGLTEKNGVSVTEFNFGSFSKWYKRPCVLLVDEPNMGREDVWATIRPAFDGAKELSVESAQGLKIKKNQSCYPILAMNPSWNPLYVGTNPINVADLRRVAPTTVGLPPEHVERSIIKAQCEDIGYDIDASTLDTIMKISVDLRACIADGSLPVPWGVAMNVKVAKMTWRFSLAKAYLRGAADGFEPQVMETIMAQVSSHDDHAAQTYGAADLF
ncbi:MAG: AAA family ATPase [Porticoccaceae bacterium]